MDMYLSRDFLRICYILNHTFILLLLGIHFIEVEDKSFKIRSN